MSTDEVSEGASGVPSRIELGRARDRLEARTGTHIHVLAAFDTAVGTLNFVATDHRLADVETDVESLVEYLKHDFVEQQLFREGFAMDGSAATYHSRGVGDYQFVSVYGGPLGGLVVIDADEPVRPVVDGVDELVGPSGT